MIDLGYVALTLLFFGLMIAYANGCQALGRDALTDRDEL